MHKQSSLFCDCMVFAFLALCMSALVLSSPDTFHAVLHLAALQFQSFHYFHPGEYLRHERISQFQFSNPRVRILSVSIISAQSYPTLCDPMDCSMPGLPVHHQLPEFTQTHVHWVGDAVQPSHPLSSPSPPTFNLSQYQGLFRSSQQVAKVLELQLQHQSFQWIFRVDFL